jgi:hypothetical protein
LAFNAVGYGIYNIQPGYMQFLMKKGWELSAESNIESTLSFHFLNLNLTSLLFNGAIFYTIGNYHIAKHGCNSLLRLVGASALAGSALASYALQND